MITAPAIRRELKGSLAVTPDARAKAIAKLREQKDGHMKLSAEAWKDDDLEILEAASLNLHNATKALRENLALEAEAAMSKCTVAEAPDETLASELVKRAEAGEPEAKKVLLAAAARLTQPKRKGEARARA
jgi:hypothetical protein